MHVSELKALKGAVESAHGCSAVFRAVEPVREMFQGQRGWEGDVATFDLRGHAKAKVCYAWTDRGSVYTVLQIPPVRNAREAVRSSVAGTIRDPT
jgi:hypothetical protein